MHAVSRWGEIIGKVSSLLAQRFRPFMTVLPLAISDTSTWIALCIPVIDT